MLGSFTTINNEKYSFLPSDDPDMDQAEKDEEMNRMRETAMKDVDTNGDGKVSLGRYLNPKQLVKNKYVM